MAPITTYRVILLEAGFHDGVCDMTCPVCGLENCDGGCATVRSSSERLRQAALQAAERRQRESPGDTLPDYEDEDERAEEDDELDNEHDGP